MDDRPTQPLPPGDEFERPDERSLHDILDLRSRPQARKPAQREPDRHDDEDLDESGRNAAGDGDSGETENKPRRRFAVFRDHPFLTLAALIVLIAAAIGGTLWYLEARHFESSDDAFIDARQFSVAPKVSGYITEVHITDNQKVRQGDVLFRIDPRDYQNAVDQAKAALGQAAAGIGNVDAQIQEQIAQIEVARTQEQTSDAALVLAQQEEARAADLVTKGAGTQQNEQQRRSALTQAQADAARTRASFVAAQKQLGSLQAQRKSAEANRDSAQAQLDQANLNLSYTTVAAAQAGTIARLTGAVGQLTQAGQAVTMFVPDRLWVTANFKETQITDMRPGQPVDLEIDAYPNRKITGHVDSIQPGSGTAFSLLPAENATGNYVKVVQRIPVKIAFDQIPPDVALGPGMSVVPRVRVR